MAGRLYSGSVANSLKEDIILQGYVSYDVDKNSSYISESDLTRFIEELGVEIANYIVSTGILSNGNLDSILMLSLGFPHKMGELRELCAEYGIENKLDKIVENLMEMHKSRIVRDGMLELTSAQMSKMVLQNEHGWFNEKNVSESTNNFNINAVASSLGSSVPMKQISNTNQGAIEALAIDVSDYIVEDDEDEVR